MRPRACLLIFFALISAEGIADTIGSEQQFVAIGDMTLVSGETLEDTMVGYRTAGTLNAMRSNVIVFPSWFTGTAQGLIEAGKIGPGQLADTDRYYVIAIDSLGNGVSTSPSNSHRQPGAEFPEIAIDDMVRAAHTLVTRHLGFDHVHAVMGISMGGMQTFQWIGQYPGFMDKAVAIDGSPRMTSYDLAQWQAHEVVIENLRASGMNDEDTMRLLSSISVLTLWTPDYFIKNIPADTWPDFMANFSKGAAQLNPENYLVQLGAMMGHDVYADHSGTEPDYPGVVQAELLVVGNPRDHVVNPTPGRALADETDALYVGIDSNCGHLGTFCEDARVTAIVNSFLEKTPSPR